MDGSNIPKPLCNTYQTISYPFLLSPKLTVKIRFSSNSVICYISLVIGFSWFMTSCLLVLGQFKAISSLRIPRARGHLDNCLIAHFLDFILSFSTLYFWPAPNHVERSFTFSLGVI